MRFLLKAITICFGDEKRFNCKNNYKSSKSANFRLDNINKINCRTLVIWLYTSSGLGSYAAGSKLLLILASSLLDEL